jgi:UDP-glucuronate 4-epimerase
MSLLVTGAMGHVGSTLVRHAAEAGLAVKAQYRRHFDRELAGSIRGEVEWVACDLADPLEAAALAADPAIEGCIHTAAVPNDRLGRPIPWQTQQSNVAATGALLDMARRCSWRRFVFVSTGSVFQGEADVRSPILEDRPTSPRTLYGTTKRIGELLTSMYRAEYGLSAASVRISWVYGPPMLPPERDLPRGPIPAFLLQALRGEAVHEPSGGDFAQSFTHVDDVARGLLAAYRAGTLSHDIYHLGSGENYPASRVARAVEAAVPGAVVELGPGTLPWTSYGALRGPLAGTRLLDDTGFTPSLALEEGIRHFAEWARGRPEIWRRA